MAPESKRDKKRAATHVANVKSSNSEEANLPGLHRSRLPITRKSVTHKFSVCGTEGYLIVGLYEDGKPGELFIKIAKEGSTLSGLFDTIGILTSLGLQYGVPMQAMIDKLKHTKFEPSGFSKNPKIGDASSLIDYIFRWLEIEFPEDLETPSFPNHGETV